MGVRYLIGTPWDYKAIPKMTVKEIWDYLSTTLSAGNTVTAGADGDSDKKSDKWGIV